ncbi:hypothetical protein BaRGS_00031057, partial [Batillaria attramentaria]
IMVETAGRRFDPSSVYGLATVQLRKTWFAGGGTESGQPRSFTGTVSSQYAK